MSETTATPQPIVVCAVEEVPEGEAIVLEADETGTGAAISVFHDASGFFALDDTCTHALASLADGWVEDGAVECPLHSARFCLKDGKALSLPATRAARTHKVEVVDGEVVLHPGVDAVGVSGA